MLKVAICDDKKDDLEKIHSLLNEYAKSRKIDIEISLFSCGSDLLNLDKDFNIAILDIVLPDIGGFELAHTMLSNSQKLRIIYYSSHIEYAPDAFSTGSAFIKKPINKQKFFNELDRLNIESLQYHIQIYDYKNIPHYVDINKILYIESADRKSYVYFYNNRLLVKMHLKNWERLLANYNFCKCSKSIIVNLEKVNEIDNSDFNEISLYNGKKLHLTRFYYTEFCEKYYLYLDSLIL